LILILFNGVLSTGQVKVSKEMRNDHKCRGLKGRDHAILAERPEETLEN
jgi:hypothetical protein